MQPRQSLRRILYLLVLGSSLWLAAGGILTNASAAIPAAFPRQQSVYAALTGTWLGPGLGDAGGCGAEYGQFTFFRNLEYAYTSNSQYCGGITNVGYYRVRNGVLTIHWVRCNYPCVAGTAAVRFGFIGLGAFELTDLGRTYIYYRQ